MKLRTGARLSINQGWLVEGESEMDAEWDELQDWKQTANWQPPDHPPDWFEREFVATGQLVADDGAAEALGCPPSSVFLFRSQAAALRFGETDAAVTSGLRPIRRVAYARLDRSLLPEDAAVDAFDEVRAVVDEMVVEGRGDCVLHSELDVLVVALRPERAGSLFGHLAAELRVDLQISGEMKEKEQETLGIPAAVGPGNAQG